MEFKTTQGGETTLVFDPGEEQVLAQVGKRYGIDQERLHDTMSRLRQADPLASFSDLVNKLPSVIPAALTERRKSAGVAQLPPRDPLVELEAEIRRRLGATASSVGATSQQQQTDAILLQALAVCLQTRVFTATVAHALERTGHLEPTDG